MPYEVLEAKIKTLPTQCITELSRYVDYLCYVYLGNVPRKADSFSEKVAELKREYADVLNDPAEADAVAHAFDNVRDKSEKVRSSENNLW